MTTKRVRVIYIIRFVIIRSLWKFKSFIFILLCFSISMVFRWKRFQTCTRHEFQHFWGIRFFTKRDFVGGGGGRRYLKRRWDTGSGSAETFKKHIGFWSLRRNAQQAGPGRVGERAHLLKFFFNYFQCWNCWHHDGDFPRRSGLITAESDLPWKMAQRGPKNY